MAIPFLVDWKEHLARDHINPQSRRKAFLQVKKDRMSFEPSSHSLVTTWRSKVWSL